MSGGGSRKPAKQAVAKTREPAPADDDADMCMVCSETRSWWGIWNTCGHAVCWRCALRIRYHSPDDTKANICCICQRDCTTEGITIAASQTPPTPEQLSTFHKDKSGWQVFYETEEMLTEVEYLRGMYCMLWDECGCETAFDSLKSLSAHYWAKHKKCLCEVCFDGNTNFPSEQSLYTQAQLRIHEKPGQHCHKDSTAFAGHPYCHFCQKLVYDNDALYMHMREAHTLCDLCEAMEGREKFVFYRDHKQLCFHMRDSHITCKVCEVNHHELVKRGRGGQRHPTEWTFATEVELQRHNREEHGAKGGVETAVKGMLFSYGRGGAGEATSSQGVRGGSEMGGDVEITFELGRGRRKTVRLGTALPQVRETRTKHDKAHEGLVSKLTELKAGVAIQDAKLYVEGGLKAIEFYAVLRSCLNPDGDVDAKLLTDIAMCIPDAEKREALRLAHNMTNDTERVSKGETLKHFTSAQAGNMAADYPSLNPASTTTTTTTASSPPKKKGPWGDKEGHVSAAAMARQAGVKPQAGAAGGRRPVEDDFPSLPGQKPMKAWQAPAVFSPHPDPPAASSSSSSSTRSPVAKAAPTRSPPAKPTLTPKPARPTADDFPTLGGIPTSHKLSTPSKHGVWGR